MDVRLIDATELRRIFNVWLSDMNDNDQEDRQAGTVICDCICQLDDAPTIDPETLPIVQELRAEIERIKKERDKAIEDLNSWFELDRMEN